MIDIHAAIVEARNQALEDAAHEAIRIGRFKNEWGIAKAIRLMKELDSEG